MIGMGLRHADRKKFEDLLVSPHQLHIGIRLLTLEHEYVRDLSDMFLDGQVDIDATQEITRSLTLSLLDPKHHIGFDTESPNDAAMFADRMISIMYSISSIDGSEQYHCPIFCGPINKVDRDGAVVNVEAKGKEKLALASLWRAKTYKKGLADDDVIRRILRDIAGENKLRIPNRKKNLPDNFNLDRNTSAWAAARRVAHNLRNQLFYNGRGVAWLRFMPARVAFTFTPQYITSQPQWGFDDENMANAVEVTGAKPKGAKHHIKVRVVAARTHPLSPWRLGRNGVPRYIPVYVDAPHCRTKSDAIDHGKQVLDHHLLESTDVTFESVVVPHIEELDVLRIRTDEFGCNFRFRKATIPLGVGTMSVGFHKVVRHSDKHVLIHTNKLGHVSKHSHHKRHHRHRPHRRNRRR